MIQDIKAIETRYAGCRFRSRAEARWAVFFDAMGWKWDYELEGYHLDDETQYLPDFIVKPPSLMKAIFEVKRDSQDEEYRVDAEAKVVATMAIAGYHVGMVVYGCPGLETPMTWLKERPGSTCPDDFAEYRSWHISDLRHIFSASKLMKAIESAKSARFEFGERGVA